MKPQAEQSTPASAPKSRKTPRLHPQFPGSPLPPWERLDQLEEEKRQVLRRPSTFELASLVATVSGQKLVGGDHVETVNTMLAVWDECGRALSEDVGREMQYVRLKSEGGSNSREFHGPFPVPFEEGLRHIFGKQRRQDARYRLFRDCLALVEPDPAMFVEMRKGITDPVEFAKWLEEEKKRHHPGWPETAKDHHLAARFTELKQTGIDRDTFEKLCAACDRVVKEAATERAKNAGMKRWEKEKA